MHTSDLSLSDTEPSTAPTCARHDITPVTHPRPTAVAKGDPGRAGAARRIKRHTKHHTKHADRLARKRAADSPEQRLPSPERKSTSGAALIALAPIIAAGRVIKRKRLDVS